MIDAPHRMAFADFLEGLARNGIDVTNWQTFAVAHYPDAELESIRCECVRLSIKAGEAFPSSDSERQQLCEWARKLRKSCDTERRAAADRLSE